MPVPARVERWRDPALAAALTAGAVTDVLVDPPATAATALLTVSALVAPPLAVRRRAPLPVALLVVSVFAATSALDDTGSPRVAAVAAVVVAVWTLGRWTSGWRTAVGVGWLAVASVGAGLTATGPGGTPVEDVLLGALLAAVPVAAGSAVRLRQASVELATERAARAEADRTRAAEESAAAERDRIARELHDIVMHSISVVAVQTQAIRRRLGPGHEQEVDDLAAVERTAREAMTEMRRLFGVLRAGDGPPQLAPQPGLGQLDRLLDDARRAGLRLDVDRAPLAAPLPPGVDLTAYRVVQEALTNALRHAGPGTAVRVAVGGIPGELRLEVRDGGPPQGTRPPAPPAPAGHGLIGMRERVAVYGGALDVGPLPCGGFRVAARLPTAGAAPAPAPRAAADR